MTSLLSNISVMVGATIFVFVLTLLACLVAARWAWLRVPNRFVPGLFLSGFSVGLGWLGVTVLKFTATKSVNGQVTWRFDSRWFFAASLVLGALVLLLTILKHRKAISASSEQPAPPRI